MNKTLNEIDWYDTEQYIKQCENILVVADQIHELKIKITKNEYIGNFDEIVFNYVDVILDKWVGNTEVGIQKSNELKNAFQLFFCELYDLLIVMRDSNIKYMNDFAKSVLYQGYVYRYLGYRSGSKKRGKVKPIFDNIYVSWSKKKDIPTVENKLCGIKTLLNCNITENNYGIDLTAFDISRQNEFEVVFPTIKKCIEKIDYI